MKQKEINDTQGRVYVIREQTGQDDDILSNISSDEATSLNTYLAGIIQKGPDGNRLTLADVEKLRLRDKYVILFKSRIFSLSENLIFSYAWPGNSESTEYSVDLRDYVWDYTKPLPEKGEPGYSEDRIKPYEFTGVIEKELSSETKVAFDILDGIGEIFLLKLKENERTINKQLVARALRVWDTNKWITVKNFGVFSSKDMMEIRNWVDEIDPPVDGNTDLQNPSTGEVIRMPVIGVKDFYYPAKI